MNRIKKSLAIASLATAVLAPVATDAQAWWGPGYGGYPYYGGYPHYGGGTWGGYPGGYYPYYGGYPYYGRHWRRPWWRRGWW